MTTLIAYVKTAKGKAEWATKPGALSSGLKQLLGMIDGSTIEDLQARLPKVPLDKLNAALDRLFVDGHIEIGSAAPARRAAPEPPPAPAKASTAVKAPPAAKSAAPAADDELDFTRFINRPVKEPTIQQKQHAEATLSGIRPSKKKAGYHVSIINRAAKRIPPHAGGDNYTVLIIDADEGNALVMARALLLAKFDTRAAAKQDEIIAQLNLQPPADVIAMDVVLPDLVGLELLGRLREHPTYKSVPVIVMTGKVEHHDVVAALAYGASGFMTKPFKPEALLDSVKAVLGL